MPDVVVVCKPGINEDYVMSAVRRAGTLFETPIRSLAEREALRSALLASLSKDTPLHVRADIERELSDAPPRRDPSTCRWNDTTEVVVKARRWRAGFLGRLDAALRKSRARRAFEAALVLEKAGVPTPEPFAYVEEPGRACIVTRFMRNEPFDFEKDAEDAARLAAKMHAAGVEHGDFKPANILAVEHGVMVVDLEQSKVGTAPPSRKARARDLGALLAYAQRAKVSLERQRAIVEAYLAAAPFEDDPEAFRQAVEKRARTKLARWARA